MMTRLEEQAFYYGGFAELAMALLGVGEGARFARECIMALQPLVGRKWNEATWHTAAGLLQRVCRQREEADDVQPIVGMAPGRYGPKLSFLPPPARGQLLPWWQWPPRRPR